MRMPVPLIDMQMSKNWDDELQRAILLEFTEQQK